MPYLMHHGSDKHIISQKSGLQFCPQPPLRATPLKSATEFPVQAELHHPVLLVVPVFFLDANVLVLLHVVTSKRCSAALWAFFLDFLAFPAALVVFFFSALAFLHAFAAFACFFLAAFAAFFHCAFFSFAFFLTDVLFFSSPSCIFVCFFSSANAASAIFVCCCAASTALE